jgi:hypothetical protein
MSLHPEVGRWYVAAGNWCVQVLSGWSLSPRWGYEREWYDGDMLSFGFGWFHVLVMWWPWQERAKKAERARRARKVCPDCHGTKTSGERAADGAPLVCTACQGGRR